MEIKQNHIECWKSDDVFIEQLNLNLNNFKNGNFPPHWIDFIKCIDGFIEKNKNYNLLDIGCGSGIYYQICSEFFPNLNYSGNDFSENAIKIAKSHWGSDCFYVKDCLQIDKDHIKEFDILHFGAVLDVLPNGDEVLDMILSLGSKNIVLGRVDFTENESYSYQVPAYNGIFTRYKHNINNFFERIRKHNYEIKQFNSTFYLKKNEN